MIVVFKDIVDLVQALVWPALIFLIFLIIILFPMSIKPLLDSVSRLVTKVSFAQVSIEFAQAKEIKSDWGQVLSDTQNRLVVMCDSGHELEKQLPQLDQTADYLVINLGTGKEWLTSRLYIAAQMLQRTKGLGCFVFVENTQGVISRFVGIAEASKVRWALAQEYPWMEKLFSKLYYENNYKIISRYGTLAEPINLTREIFIQGFLRYFMQRIQCIIESKTENEENDFREINIESMPDSHPEDWVSLGYLFNWNNVPGKDENKLLNFLKKSPFFLNWQTTPNITKIDDTGIKKYAGKTILISDEKTSAKITFDKNNITATLTISGLNYTYPLQVEEKNHEFKIYRYRERANWLKPVDIEKLLGEDLYKTYVIDSPGVSEEQRVKFIISHDEPFVAVVNEDRQFIKLIDRSKLIEKVARDRT